MFHCTLGVPCDIEVEGYQLPAESAMFLGCLVVLAVLQCGRPFPTLGVGLLDLKVSYSPVYSSAVLPTPNPENPLRISGEYSVLYWTTALVTPVQHSVRRDAPRLAVAGSCSDSVLRPASVDYVRLQVASAGAGDGDMAHFFWNDTEIPVQEASDLVFVVFDPFQQGSPLQFGFNASSMRSSYVVHALRSVADQSLVLVAAKGLVSPLGTFAPRLLAQLTAMGAQKLNSESAYVSYALALFGGQALAEQGAGPREGPVVIQEFVSTAASPKAAEIAGRVRFGQFHGSAGILTLCWESQLTQWSSWRGQGFKVDVGHLHVEGPFPDTWTCFAGSPCTITVQGQALADFPQSEITLESRPDSGYAVHSNGSEDSDAGDIFAVIGWHRGPLAGQVQDMGGEQALEFSFGVALERKLIALAVYWRAAPSTEWTFIGKLHLREHLCRLADEGPGETHNCSAVPFRDMTGPHITFFFLIVSLVASIFVSKDTAKVNKQGASCVSRCLTGWSGPVSTLVCEADGRLTGQTSPTKRY